MNIQSLSVVVPAKRCVNNCKPCVSKMHDAGYENMIDPNNLYFDLYKKDYISRLDFARNNGCNTVMLTGDCEPLQNRGFLATFGMLNEQIQRPFRIIELQTAGNLITNDYLYFLRHHVRVSTISLSLFCFDSVMNSLIIGCKEFDIVDLCKRIKTYRFNLRLSLNMSRYITMDKFSVAEILSRCSAMGADQVIFRKLYTNGSNKESKWINENNVPSSFWVELDNYIEDEGTLIDRLEYGRNKYEVHGMSIVVDNDCMSTEAKDVAKYLILRENCKLYSKWDTPASLIF